MTRRVVPAAGARRVGAYSAKAAPVLRAEYAQIVRAAAAHGLFRPATDQRLRARLDLWPDRHRLHHGLRHRRHDQFRPWRYLHDRRLHRVDHVPDPGVVRAHLRAGDPADRALGIDGDHRTLWLDGGADRLSAAAALVPPRPD